MRAALAAVLVAAALGAPAALKAQEVSLPAFGLQVGIDKWRSDPGAPQVGSGPGFGFRYESDAFGPIGVHAFRAFFTSDIFLLKDVATAKRVFSVDMTTGLTVVLPLGGAVTPYAGGGLGFLVAGQGRGVSPVASIGAQLARGGKSPYVDLTWWTRNNRRIVLSVGMFL